MIHERFVINSKNNPSKTALRDMHSGKAVSFGKALTAVLILSKKFRKTEEVFTGVLLPTSQGCALTVVSLLASGKIPVMINYSTGAEKNILYAMEKCGFSRVITSKYFIDKIGCPQQKEMIFLEDIIKSISLKEKVFAGLKSKLPLRSILSELHSCSEDEPAVVLFTSGSEKEPKAIQLSHKNLLSNIQACAEALGIEKEDVFMNILPPFHVFGYNVNLVMPLVLGCTSLTYPNPLDYKTVVDIIRKEKPTLIAGSPYFLSNYSKHSQTGDFSSLKLVISGADKAQDWLLDEYFEKHGIKILEGYGTTETSPVISVNTPFENKKGSIGKPLKNLSVEIHDLDSGKKLGAGEKGKILVKGDSVMSGYFDDLEETSFRLRDGWYDTGDIGYTDSEGFLWHSGRLRRCVKIGGEMISLVAIENRIEQILGPENECCVVDIPDKKRGSKIVAVMSKETDTAGLRSKLSSVLPNVAIPKNFIVIPDLPKMGSGKNDFRKISDIVKKNRLISD
ncbi:AMP-binding protein [candidate division WOR-3 bacterium]|nr:AMP-binding protein [candidate division WOR-3 bacterium]